jgi:hypothetical protein
MMMTKMSLVISVKKFTLIGLNLNFPSTLDMYTSIGYTRGKEAGRMSKQLKNVRCGKHTINEGILALQQ